MKLLQGRDTHQQHFLLSKTRNGQEQVELPLLPPSTLLCKALPYFVQAVSEEVRMQQALGTTARQVPSWALRQIKAQCEPNQLPWLRVLALLSSL